MFDIRENLKILPDKPGVYLYKDKYGEVIYVGKAVSLKKRVRQYFQSTANLAVKVRALVKDIDEFEYIITDSEMEALILENNLIKKYMPRYNVLLRDDKTYPYIKVTLNEEYPRVIKTRRVINDGGKYFGPYTDVGAVNQIIELLNKVFVLKKCPSLKFPDSFRPCLNYHIGLCYGICNDNISTKEYSEIIDKVLEFLKGRSEDTERELTERMMIASENMEFEKAAELRDTISAIQIIKEKQKIVTNPQNDMDVIVSVEAEPGKGTNIMLFFIRSGKMIGRESFRINFPIEETAEEKVASFIKQYYCDEALIPKEILVEGVNDEYSSIQQWLTGIKGSGVSIHVPQRGEKKAILDMCIHNILQTKEVFEKRVKNEKEKAEALEKGLRELLGTERPIRRIEAYDISNTLGVNSVGGMVVFENGKKVPRDYRKFKIRTIEGANDYGSLQEVIYRRFSKYFEAENNGKSNGFEKKPDILLIDGGDKQVAAVEKVIKAMKLDIPVVGMVKDDKHRTRDLVYREKLSGLMNNYEIYRFIYFIQEEVHRFSIEYHKNLRDKAMKKSILEDIPGIGEVRRKKLTQHFGSVEKIKQASVEELAAVDGMNMNSATAVFDFFNNSEDSNEKR